MSLPRIHSINYRYFPQLMQWKGYNLDVSYQAFKVEGFDDYNRLIDINKIFSESPLGNPVDRTMQTKNPINFKVNMPWQVPTVPISLDSVFETRTQEFINQDKRINILWSGGMDSTAIITAFLTHAPQLDQLRIIYSPFSLYENRGFFEYLRQNYPALEMIDMSGDVYFTTCFDGIFVNGHGSDELTASLDDSFYNKLSVDQLLGPWQDYFYQTTQDQQLIDFCEKHFAQAGKPIESLLDARWWYYASTKNHVHEVKEAAFFLNYPNFNVNLSSGFFNCPQFDTFMWFNTDQILEDPHDYKTYKKFLRHYIYKQYRSRDYRDNGVKLNSVQIEFYRNKKTALLDLDFICLLEDSTVVRTSNLPLFSKKEFDTKYGSSLDYLFNQIPCTVA